jgi:hypothetical protein
MRILMLLTALSLLLSSAANAGSICNDGTYSHSEGRGTCSWHGGVSSSGVYQNSNSTSRNTLSTTSNTSYWESSYDITATGEPYHYAERTNANSSFVYVCHVPEDLTSTLPDEQLILTVWPLGIVDSAAFAPAPKDHIKVFAHTKSGYTLISGNWAWASRGGFLVIKKYRSAVDDEVAGMAMAPGTAQLTKADLVSILRADHLLVSVEGHKDITIQTSGIANRVASTWSKCAASQNAASK